MCLVVSPINMCRSMTCGNSILVCFLFPSFADRPLICCFCCVCTHTESMTWEQPKTKGIAPFPRMLHTAVMFEDTLVVHAGSANNLLLEDLWEYDANSGQWTELMPAGMTPFARMGATLVAISPPMNPTPYVDNRPPWSPPNSMFALLVAAVAVSNSPFNRLCSLQTLCPARKWRNRSHFVHARNTPPIVI